MNYSELVDQIKAKQSFLCVGLDIDEQKLPAHLKGTANGVVEFAKAIIEATFYPRPSKKKVWLGNRNLLSVQLASFRCLHP